MSGRTGRRQETLVLRRLSVVIVFFSLIASALAQLPPKPLVLRHVTVLDVTGKPPQTDVDILIQNTTISAIGPKLTAPKNAQVVDATGKFVMPGLIDLRVQISGSPANRMYRAEVGEEQRVAWLHSLLASGVTSVRLVQGSLEEQKYFRFWRQADQINAPFVFVDGPTLTAQDGNPTNQYSINAVGLRTAEVFEITSDDDARNKSRAVAHNGADAFEVVYDAGPGFAPYPRLTEDNLRIIVTEAHGHELKVFCSVGHNEEAATAIAAGCDAIEEVSDELLSPETLAEMAKKKIGFVPELVSQTEVLKLLDPAALRAYLEQPQVKDHLSPLIQKSLASETGMIAVLRKQLDTKISLEPVEQASKQTAPAADKKPQSDEAQKPAAPAADAQKPVTAAAPSGTMPMIPAREATIRVLMEKQAERALENVRRAHQAGVPILVGTGAGSTLVFPGPSMARELELLVSAGFTVQEALQAATLNNARALGKEADIGAIAAGKRADLLLLNANPLADIRNLARIDSVVRAGRKIDPDQMYIY